MATVVGRVRCVTCGKEKATSKCEGCLQDFCYNHLGEHRQQLNKQLDEIEVNRDLFRETLTHQTKELHRHELIPIIDEWELDSINKIRQAAKEAKQLLLKYTDGHITEIEDKLSKLTNQLRLSRQDNDITEKDLDHWKGELTRLTNQLAKPSNLTIRQDSTPLVNKIYVDVSPISLRIRNIGANAKWIPNGITVAGGNGSGNEVNQLCRPHGLYVDDDQTIYVADFENHRIVEWKNGATSGQVVAGGNGLGNRNDQLSRPTDVILDKKTDSLIICDYGNKRVMRWPRRNGPSGTTIISKIDGLGLAMDNDGYLYVSDISKHEVRRWKIGDSNGTVVAGGNGIGDRLNQLSVSHHISVDEDRSVYVSDCENYRVMKWVKGAKEGILVAGGQDQGEGLTQLSRPFGVVVDQLGTVYVADFNKHRVMRWQKGATQGSIVVGRNGPGGQANQLSNPLGVSFDQQNNLYVVDQYNHRVQKFNIDPSFEFGTLETYF